jgi:signal transduction histidine kinase
MKQRLYFRLYLTLLAVTLVCLIAVGIAFRVLGGPGRAPAEHLRLASSVLIETVPDLDFPAETDRLAALADDLGVDLAVWDSHGLPLATATRRAFLAPRHLVAGWAHGRPGVDLVLVIALGPDRYLGVRNRYTFHRPNPFFFTLVALALFVAAGSYPVARRITRRLETLEGGVRRWGTGDLGYRVAVEGQDEVATLAHTFNDAAGQIAALVAQQREMVANASHELRSPLARIRLGLEMIGEEPDHERRARMLESLRKDVMDLDGIIEEVLLVARADARSPYRQLEPVDLRALIAEESARVGATLIEGEDVILRGDAKMLRHLVRNLLENAERHGSPDVVARIEPDADAVVLAVEDRGPGIPEAERERIFAPFYRLPGGKPDGGGVGLGLALVRQVARYHGGEARVVERGGGGSRFEVRLPLGPLGSREG